MVDYFPAIIPIKTLKQVSNELFCGALSGIVGQLYYLFVISNLTSSMTTSLFFKYL